MKCLVTGAAGFIGSHLCEKLLKEGHEVYGVDDLSCGRMSNLDSIIAHKNFLFTKCDLLKTRTLPPSIEWIFHLAAKADVVPSIEDPIRYHEVNVNVTIGLLEYARAIKAKRFIYAASSSCYGIPDSYPTNESAELRPMYPYALTKMVGEQYVLHWSKVYSLPALSLRLFNVFGPRHRTSGNYGAVFGTFLAQLANRQPVTIVGDGSQKRDFTFVTDVCWAFIKAAESRESGYAVNIGTGTPHSVSELVELLGGRNKTFIPDRPGEPRQTCANYGLARERLGWRPRVAFGEGVAIMRGLISSYKDAPVWTRQKIEEATKTWFDCLGEK